MDTYSTFVKLLLLAVIDPLTNVSNVRKSMQKYPRKWISFCQKYFPQISEEYHFQLMHLSVRYAMHELLGHLLMYGPIYHRPIPDNVTNNLKHLFEFDGETLPTDIVIVFELLENWQWNTNENVFVSGVSPMQILNDFVLKRCENSRKFFHEIGKYFDEESEESVEKTVKNKQNENRKLHFWKNVYFMTHESIHNMRINDLQTTLSLLISEKGYEFGQCFVISIWPEIVHGLEENKSKELKAFEEACVVCESDESNI